MAQYLAQAHWLLAEGVERDASMKTEGVIGLLLVFLFFLPTAFYQYSCCEFGSDIIMGSLYGYMLPYGYIALICGIVLVLRPHFKPLHWIKPSHLLIVAGVFVLLGMVFSKNVDYFLSSWHGIGGEWTVQVDGVANLIAVTIPALSIAAGLIKENKKMQVYFPDI